MGGAPIKVSVVCSIGHKARPLVSLTPWYLHANVGPQEVKLHGKTNGIFS
jgi:hypothetical protein